MRKQSFPWLQHLQHHQHTGAPTIGQWRMRLVRDVFEDIYANASGGQTLEIWLLSLEEASRCCSLCTCLMMLFR